MRCCIGLYTMFSFPVIAEHEIYSVWVATGRELGEFCSMPLQNDTRVPIPNQMQTCSHGEAYALTMFH